MADFWVPVTLEWHIRRSLLQGEYMLESELFDTEGLGTWSLSLYPFGNHLKEKSVKDSHISMYLRLHKAGRRVGPTVTTKFSLWVKLESGADEPIAEFTKPLSFEEGTERNAWGVMRAFPRSDLDRYINKYGMLTITSRVEVEITRSQVRNWLESERMSDIDSRIYSLFSNTSGSDLEVLINGIKYRLHRFVLEDHCPALMKMIAESEAQRDSLKAGSDPVKLELDSSEASVDTMLRFVYGGMLRASPRGAYDEVELVWLGERLGLPGLVCRATDVALAEVHHRWADLLLNDKCSKVAELEESLIHDLAMQEPAGLRSLIKDPRWAELKRRRPDIPTRILEHIADRHTDAQQDNSSGKRRIDEVD